MALDFQQIREQVRQLGVNAPGREQRLQDLRQKAFELLQSNANQLEQLRQKVQLVARSFDPSLRCATPVHEALDARFPLPDLPERMSVLAADGSQIYLDRHAAVEYFLINIGTIQMCFGDGQAPKLATQSDLFYGDQLTQAGGYFSEDKISLLRDLRERERLADLAAQVSQPVLTLTDGPLEIWGIKSSDAGRENPLDQSLDAYLAAQVRLYSIGATTAGYVDKPAEDYVVRLLEVASQPEAEAKNRPLFGVRDVDLYRRILRPGERSAVFEVQSRSARMYSRYNEALSLHFFYLNVGRAGHPWLARVETFAWVAREAEKMNVLQAVLIHQCRTMGAHPYPYLLHRAHETALVSMDEKRQLELMILNELRKHGLTGAESHKQGLKNLAGKERYSR